MTPAERAKAEREAQGLPEHVADPAVLDGVAVLVQDRVELAA